MLCYAILFLIFSYLAYLAYSATDISKDKRDKPRISKTFSYSACGSGSMLLILTSTVTMWT